MSFFRLKSHICHKVFKLCEQKLNLLSNEGGTSSKFKAKTKESEARQVLPPILHEFLHNLSAR